MLRFCATLLISISLQACAFHAGLPPTNEIPVYAGKIRADKTVRSWKELRDQNVVIQKYDYSCGAAALATLMRYYFGDPASEESILLSILSPMDREEIEDRETNGLSLLDLKRCAERMGYQAAGVKLNYKGLSSLKGPVLVHLEKQGYKHFVVLKGVLGDRVYLADPSRGNIRLFVDRFAREWSGIALVLGKKGFGLPDNYPLALRDLEPVPDEILAARRSLFTR